MAYNLAQLDSMSIDEAQALPVSERRLDGLAASGEPEGGRQRVVVRGVTPPLPQHKQVRHGTSARELREGQGAFAQDRTAAGARENYSDFADRCAIGKERQRHHRVRNEIVMGLAEALSDRLPNAVVAGQRKRQGASALIELMRQLLELFTEHLATLVVVRHHAEGKHRIGQANGHFRTKRGY